MDYAKGREKPANHKPENSSDASSDRRADWCKEAYGGQAFRSLEKELGNPGYFCHQKSQHNGERSVPAPYYPHHENNKHHNAPHAGTIPPVVRENQRSNSHHQGRENCLPCEAPGRAQYSAREPYQYYQNSRDQSYRVAPPSQLDAYGPQGYDSQFSSNEYGPQSYDQRYVRRDYGPQNYAPSSNSCNDVCNNPERYNYPGMDYDQSRQYEAQQFDAVREQARQQRYSRQQSMINGDIFFNSSVAYRNQGNGYQQQWWQDTQMPFEPGRRNMPSGNPELDSYREQWWNQANNPDGSRYYPGRNPELDNQRRQWWEQSQYPGDSRYQPGRNPELNNFREQWWRNAQTRPDGYYGPQAPPYPGSIDQGYPPDGYENVPPDQYDPRRDQYDPRGDRYDNRDAVQFQNMGRAIKSVLGHSVEEFDRTVPARLGCVRAVSLVLERTYGMPIRDQNTDRIQETLLSNGWVSIDPSRVQEGDVIIGDRGEGKHGHAAIYVGNDQIFNNDSNTGVMQFDSANKFRTGEFVKIKAYRKVR